MQRVATRLHLALQREREAAVARTRCKQTLRQAWVLFGEQRYLWKMMLLLHLYVFSMTVILFELHRWQIVDIECLVAGN